jgi:hypothetical protein
MTYIKITRNYYINNFEKKVIKEIIKNVKKKDIYNNYKHMYHTQKYSLKQIITFILIKIKYSLTWAGLGKHRSNIHKHFLRFCKYDIFTDTYEDLLQKYIISNKSKCVYADTTAIINKGGINKIKKNRYYYGKNCNKINLCIDDKKVPIDIDFYEGNVYDSKILYNKLKQNNKLINKLKSIKCKTFIADAGYCSIKNRKTLEKNKITPIIKYNNRGIKKEENKKYLTKDELKKYKNRIKVEHVFGNLKQKSILNVRNDKNFISYTNLVIMYFLLRIIKYIK